MSKTTLRDEVSNILAKDAMVYDTVDKKVLFSADTHVDLILQAFKQALDGIELPEKTETHQLSHWGVKANYKVRNETIDECEAALKQFKDSL